MSNYKDIALNKIAYHEYFVDEKYETGISLDGAEVKSARLGNLTLKDSFCLITERGVVIKNMHIAIYDKSGAFNAKDAKRDRLLLLHKSEIRRLRAKVTQKGYALVPLKAYLKDALIKIEIGLCRGKHTYDKKETLKQADIKRDTERQINRYK